MTQFHLHKVLKCFGICVCVHDVVAMRDDVPFMRTIALDVTCFTCTF